MVICRRSVCCSSSCIIYHSQRGLKGINGQPPGKKIRRNRRKNAVLRYQKEKWRNQAASPGVHDFILLLDHLKPGFNIPKIFRSAEAFGAREVHLINIAPFDPAPAKGAFRKVPAHFHATFRDCHEFLRKQGSTLFILQANCDTILHQRRYREKAPLFSAMRVSVSVLIPLIFPIFTA